MDDILKRYKEMDYPMPQTVLAWQMYGAGLENFGKDGKPAELPFPSPGPDEILVRVDAIGICFSDLKLITQGSRHPRVLGRDLVANPVVPGHEVSITVVRAGENLKDKFKPGERYVVQADVYYKGRNLAYGYALTGGMIQYETIGEEILKGDAGCYLLPVKPETGYAEAALTEPWACVVGAYRIRRRQTIEPGGVTLFVEASGCLCDEVVISEGIDEKSRPAKIITAKLCGKLAEDLADRCARLGIEFIETEPLDEISITALAQERTGERGFDDIIVLGVPSPQQVEMLAARLAKGGTLAVIAKEQMAAAAAVDVGRVHYDDISFVGTTGNDVADAYRRERVSELKPGGTAWFIGAAGPMGQMHVQLAAEMDGGPAKILATDVDSGRMQALKDLVADKAAQRGIDIRFLNPKEDGQESVDRAIEELTGGEGFDDVVLLAPIPFPIPEGIESLGRDGVFNIFAGLPRGTEIGIDLTPMWMKNVRMVGSSGSSIEDLRDTLGRAESGRLSTNLSVAAIGGIDALGDGVAGVKSNRFTAKTVIFPQIELPLTAVPDLKDILPNVYAKLQNGRYWTKEAEEELLRQKLRIG
ncbi:MAG: zinc-binding dehydrogenase [Armatimonadota bacterium]|nr:zinc-binding dehydrogenase [Armatimonadota bacterium]